MKLRDEKGIWDWWAISGLLFIISGLEIFLLEANDNNMMGGIIIGGINLLAGIALTKYSLFVFRLLRILFLGSFFFAILAIITGTSELDTTVGMKELMENQTLWISLAGYLNLILNLGMLGSLVMLWRKLKQEKKVNW